MEINPRYTFIGYNYTDLLTDEWNEISKVAEQNRITLCYLRENRVMIISNNSINEIGLLSKFEMKKIKNFSGFVVRMNGRHRFEDLHQFLDEIRNRTSIDWSWIGNLIHFKEPLDCLQLQIGV